MTLREITGDTATRPKIIQDCVELIDAEVKSKGGFSGIAVKSAYSIVKAIKPGIIREAVDMLLDPFVEKIEPFFETWQDTHAGVAFETFASDRQNEIANSLLGVTDARAEKAENGTLKKAYKSLRPKAIPHVEQAVPGIARVIEKHGRD